MNRAVARRKEGVQLTAEQAAALERLRDQMGIVVDQQMARQSGGGTRSVVARAMQDPTVALDEQAIRAEACEEARQQADLSVQMIRTQRGVAQVLTPAQQRKLAELQAAEMMQVMQGMFEPSKRP